MRLKTGTTPRIDKKSVDFSRPTAIESEPDTPPFSFLHDSAVGHPQSAAVVADLHQRRDPSASSASNICTARPCTAAISKAAGRATARPSKTRSSGSRSKPSHQVFLEQEGWDTDSLYVQGTSTSLPAEVQLEFLHTIPGLEECVMLKAGYAVEYDAVPPTELTHALMTKRLPGLFLAGRSTARPATRRPPRRA